MRTTLLIGYGNPDRQDDGVALHILVYLAKKLGRSLTDPVEDSFYPTGEQPDLWFDLQLFPEMAETISRYDRVAFIDAHTGNIPDEIQIAQVHGFYQPSSLTHHMTPSTLLSLCESISRKTPEANLVSVRGYQFGFSRELSLQTCELVEKAASAIESWLKEDSN